METRLFIIPWIFLGYSAAQPAPTVPLTTPPALNNLPGNYLHPSFYEMLQRQNQLNNALLLNNALINTQMNKNVNQLSRLHNFPLGLPPHPHLYPAHLQGLIPQYLPGTSAEKLAIYDALSPMTSQTRDAHQLPPVSQSEQLAAVQAAAQAAGVVSFTPPPTKKSELDEIVFLTADSKLDKHITDEEEKLKAAAKTTTAPRVIEERPFSIKSVKKSASAETSPKPKPTEAPIPPNLPDVYNLLRHLNLTEQESAKLVEHVERVVREELAKKLIETKLAALTLAPRRVSTTERTTVEEPATVTPSLPSTTTLSLPPTEPTPAPTTTESSFIIPEPVGGVIPGKFIDKPVMIQSAEEVEIERSTVLPSIIAIEEEPIEEEDDNISEMREIKLHPSSRVKDKDGSYQGTAIKTAERHLLILERSGDDDSSEKREKEVTEPAKTTEATTTTTTEPTTTIEFIDTKKSPFILRTPNRNEESEILDLATGAPLDLSETDVKETAVYRNRFVNQKPPTPKEPQVISTPRVRTRPRIQTVPQTEFEKLASDYRQRLTGTEDVSKLLKTFYDNAFIQLVESEPKKLARAPATHHG